jgi:hypothetical protein
VTPCSRFHRHPAPATTRLERILTGGHRIREALCTDHADEGYTAALQDLSTWSAKRSPLTNPDRTIEQAQWRKR